MIDANGGETAEVHSFVATLKSGFDEELAVNIRAIAKRLCETRSPDEKTALIVGLSILGTALTRPGIDIGPHFERCAIESFRAALEIIDLMNSPDLGEARMATLSNLANLLRTTAVGDHTANLQEAHGIGVGLLTVSPPPPQEIVAMLAYNQGLCAKELISGSSLDFLNEALRRFKEAQEIWKRLGQHCKVINATLQWIGALVNSPFNLEDSAIRQINVELQGLQSNPCLRRKRYDWAQTVFAVGHLNYGEGRRSAGLSQMINAVAQFPIPESPTLFIKMCLALSEVQFRDKHVDDGFKTLVQAESAIILAVDSLHDADEIDRLMSEYAGVYDKIISWHLERGNNEAAWTFAERSKTRSLRGPIASFEQVRLFASRAKCCILQLYLAEEYFVIFRLDPRGAKPEAIKRDRTNLNELLRAVRHYLLLYQLRRSEWETQLPALLLRICNALDLNELVPDKEDGFATIAIVPHRSLHVIPFGALRVRGKHLAEYCAEGLRTGLSASSLAFCSDVLSPQPANLDSIILLDNPNNDLDFAGYEAGVIIKQFRDVIRLQGREATATGLLQRRSKISASSVVHFACHGSFDGKTASRSFLQMADGQMDVASLVRHRFDFSACRLICLSACETGIVDVNTFSDEYFGMSWAFLASGARNVLSTLWAVDDLSTAIFMKAFYESLHAWSANAAGPFVQGLSVALRGAQDRVKTIALNECVSIVTALDVDETRKQLHIQRLLNLDDPPFSKPYYWAPFVIASR